MEMSEVKKLTDEELSVESTRVRRKLFDMRTQAVSDKIADTSQFKKLRKDLARLQTESTTRGAAARRTA